jgi:hypothetical protein
MLIAGNWEEEEYLRALLLFLFIMVAGSFGFRLWPFEDEGLGPTLIDTLKYRLPLIAALPAGLALVDRALTAEHVTAAATVVVITIMIHYGVMLVRARSH